MGQILLHEVNELMASHAVGRRADLQMVLQAHAGSGRKLLQAA